MNLILEPYLAQLARWPRTGRHILAQFDDHSIIVYQAFAQVRLQWDPDHDPAGGKVERRAIQLGLRGEMLGQYAREWVIDIEDISDFVSEQRQYAQAHMYEQLTTPRELIYSVADAAVASRLGLALS